jgi:hypothetical protein
MTDPFSPERIRHLIARLKKKMSKYDVPEPHKVFNYFGGQEQGGCFGQILILTELLEELEEREVNV